MNTLVRRSSNLSRKIIEDAELLVCICFSREIDELEDIASFNLDAIDWRISHHIDFVSNEIITKYAQLKTILQNLEGHTSLIRSWVTLISREFKTVKDAGILTSVNKSFV